MDFKNSLAAGIQAAKKSRDNKNEILSVIDELSNSVKDYSGGHVSLEITRERKLSVGQTTLSVLAGTFNGENPYIDYEALSFIKTEENTRKKIIIAEWKINETDGYPCIISYNKKDVRCRDKETLTIALDDLVSNASTGEMLFSLLDNKEE